MGDTRAFPDLVLALSRQEETRILMRNPELQRRDTLQNMTRATQNVPEVIDCPKVSGPQFPKSVWDMGMGGAGSITLLNLSCGQPLVHEKTVCPLVKSGSGRNDGGTP